MLVGLFVYCSKTIRLSCELCFNFRFLATANRKLQIDTSDFQYFMYHTRIYRVYLIRRLQVSSYKHDVGASVLIYMRQIQR